LGLVGLTCAFAWASSRRETLEPGEALDPACGSRIVLHSEELLALGPGAGRAKSREASEAPGERGADCPEASGAAEGPPVERWDLGVPSLPSRDGFESEAERFSIDASKLAAEDRSAIIELCASWNARMAEVSSEILGYRATRARHNIEAGIDCARVDSPEAEVIRIESELPNVIAMRMCAGRGIALDGQGGEFVVLIRRGDVPQAEQAHRRLEALFRDASLALEALVAKLAD
jgi:hypothetical protein